MVNATIGCVAVVNATVTKSRTFSIPIQSELHALGCGLPNCLRTRGTSVVSSLFVTYARGLVWSVGGGWGELQSRAVIYVSTALAVLQRRSLYLARVGGHVGGSQPVVSAIFAGGKAAQRGAGTHSRCLCEPPRSSTRGSSTGAATLSVFRNSMHENPWGQQYAGPTPFLLTGSGAVSPLRACTGG